MKLLVGGLKLPFSADVSIKLSFHQLKSIKIVRAVNSYIFTLLDDKRATASLRGVLPMKTLAFSCMKGSGNRSFHRQPKRTMCGFGLERSFGRIWSEYTRIIRVLSDAK